MALENIEIKTSKEKFFQEYLILKKPIIDAILSKINGGKKTTLSDIPRKVFAQLLYYNDHYKNENEEKKWNIVFSKEIKDKICENLGMKEHHLNIYISQLRGLKILTGKKINKFFIVYAEDKHSINFIFNLNGSGQ